MLQNYDPKNRDLLLFVNGRIVHREEAGVSPFDSSVQNGDAVWEGLRLYSGRIFRLEDHLARLRRSAHALNFEGMPSDREIIEALRETLKANGMHDGVHIRLTVTRGIKYTSGLDPRLNRAGCSLIIIAEWKAPVFDKAGIRLITAGVRRPSADVLDQKIHSCNQLVSILAKLEANRAGVDDALLLDSRGFLAETSSTNVFLIRDGAVRTPRAVACPEGVTRRVVLEICASEGIPVREEDLTLSELFTADEAFCTGTMGELVPIVELDGRSVGGLGGPWLPRINAVFRHRTEHEGFRILAETAP